MKIYQETHDNLFGIFARNYNMRRGSVSKKEGAIINKNKKRKKAQGP